MRLPRPCCCFTQHTDYETHPATIARPEVATPIVNLVAVLSTEIVDEHFMHSSSSAFNPNLTDVNSNMILVIERWPVRKLLDMQILLRNTCRARN